MAEDQVRVERHMAAAPSAVWAVLRNFADGWHPAIDRMLAVREAGGALVRSFTVKGETTLYRERLTYFSDSDRALGYTHLEGIAGARHYDGWQEVRAAEDGGSHVTFSARVVADEPRLQEIVSGTRAIFIDGLEVLERLAVVPQGSRVTEAPAAADTAVSDQILGVSPRLGLTATAPTSDGRLCLFLHGIGGARWNWRPQLHAAGDVMRAAALDLRGYGDSTLGADPSTIEAYCNDILAVRQALGAEKLVLVGLSYGSWIATSFAMRHPDLLAGLVLSGGCTGMSEAQPAEREAFLKSRQVPLDAGKTPADFAPDVVKVLAGPNASDETRAALLASMAAIPAATYRDAVHCFCHPPARFDFSRLTMPVLMMTGEFDQLASPAEIRGVAQRIHAAVPHADVRFEVIAGAGHVVNVEAPDAYNHILVDFLARLPA